VSGADRAGLSEDRAPLTDRPGLVPQRPGPGERGSVTAEFAVMLPAVVAVLAVALLAASVAIAQVRCADAARAAARAAAIGAPTENVLGTARALAGADAAVGVTRDGAWVVVRVERGLRGLPWAGGPLTASAEARAWVEPAASASAP
jgi:hypothetical protein